MGVRTPRRALALILAFGLSLPATAQALTWGSPVNVTAEGGTYALVSCASVSSCTVVNGGYAYTFSPTDPHAANGQVLPSLPGFTSFTCPSVSECVLLSSDSRVVSFDPATTGHQIVGQLPIDAAALACSSATECTAAGTTSADPSAQPAAVMINPQRPGATETSTFSGDVGVAAQAISCPSTAQCTIVGDGDQVQSFSPMALGVEPPGDVATVAVGYAKTIACPATTQCTLGDQTGYVNSFNPQDPATTNAETPIANATDNGITALACASATDCLAGLGTGGLLEGDPQTTDVSSGTFQPDTWSSDLTAAQAVNEISCPSATVCVAVDAAGDVFTAPPPTSTRVSGTVNGLPALTGPPGRATVADITQTATGLKLKLTCTGAATDRCEFILRLAAGVHTAPAAARDIAITPGTVTTTLPYAKAARALLARDRTLKGTLVAVQEVQGGTVTLDVHTLTLRAARR